MRVRAAVVEKKSGSLVLQELDPDEPRLDEVLKELSPPVATTGICQTDGHVRNQDYPVPLPLVLGHEGRASSGKSPQVWRASNLATTW
jgi:aryl-alcohol dehydrogenase